jgi:FkbM family methyltransferase
MTAPLSTQISVPAGTARWMRDEIERGIYERIEQEWSAELPGGDVALELGAGIGMVTRVLAQKYRRVVSIDANAQLAEHWAANVAGARAELRIGLICAGAIGVRPFHVAREEWWKSTTSPVMTTALGSIRDVNVATLDLEALIDEVSPDVIMCDIEGAEAHTLVEMAERGALARVRDLIVELHPGLWTADGIHQREIEGALRSAMTHVGFTVLRATIADGYPPGTPHPIGISHVWWRQ